MIVILRCSVIGDDTVFELISISSCRSKDHKAVGLLISLDFEKLTVVEVVVFGISDGTLWIFILEAKAMVQKHGSHAIPHKDSSIFKG